MTQTVHEILGGNVQLFRRPNSERWHRRASINGTQFRHSTGQTSLASAKDVAEDWYLTLKGKVIRVKAVSGKTFKFAAERFMLEYKVLTQGQRSPIYLDSHWQRLRPF